MKCPHCAHSESRVVDSRPAEDGEILRRRRICDRCGARFTTHERTVLSPLIVVKKDGRREEFNADKLRNGIVKACNKLPVATSDIEVMIRDVEATLRQESLAEAGAEHIGELVMERLFLLNEVAYVRFASVYQRFDDVRRFAQLLERMSRRARRGPRDGGKGKVTGNGEVHGSEAALGTSDVSADEGQPTEMVIGKPMKSKNGSDASAAVAVPVRAMITERPK